MAGDGYGIRAAGRKETIIWKKRIKSVLRVNIKRRNALRRRGAICSTA